MVGEALAHVQASRLKANAVVYVRLTNSPVTSSNVGGRYRKRGVYEKDFHRNYLFMPDVAIMLG